MTDQIEKGLLSETMICPCCGHRRAIVATVCACGARQVAPPLRPPDVVLPKLGPALIALGLPLFVLCGFVAFWLLGNDMKVGRALLVWAVGDGTKLTRSLLDADPGLWRYRIFAYDGYRLAILCSMAVVPLSFIGVRLARRALRLAQVNPTRFGGLKTAQASLVLSAVLLLTFSTIGLSGIPNAIERGRLKRMAATRALMHALHHETLVQYHREYGTYPRELSDLSRLTSATVPAPADYWARTFSYSPFGVVATRGNAVAFGNYKLVSAGADGTFGTADDITMIDGVVVEKPSDTDLPESLLAPEKPRP